MSPGSTARDSRPNLRQRRHRARKLRGAQLRERLLYMRYSWVNLGSTRFQAFHRISTRGSGPSQTWHGHEQPPENRRGGSKKAFDDCMRRAAELIRADLRRSADEAQYLVHVCAKTAGYMKMKHARRLAHVRASTGRKAHPDYRFLCQEMWARFRKFIRRLGGVRQSLSIGKISVGVYSVRQRTKCTRAGRMQNDRRLS